MGCRLLVVFFLCPPIICFLFLFFFNDTPTAEIYTLSLHDALPIYAQRKQPVRDALAEGAGARPFLAGVKLGEVSDRKSTRLNSSHSQISYAVFCLKKKKKKFKTYKLKDFY